MSFRTSGGTLTKQVQYTYDVFDRLIGKAVDDDGDGIFDRSARFVYDGDDVVLSFDGAGSLTHRYLHGDAVDQVFACEDDLGEVLWALTDYQGTVRDVADYDVPTDALTFVNQRTFDSFGTQNSEADPSLSMLDSDIRRYEGKGWEGIDVRPYRASRRARRPSLSGRTRTATAGSRTRRIPTTTAILDRFLQDAELIQITGRSYRLRGRTAETSQAKTPVEPAKPTSAKPANDGGSKPAKPANSESKTGQTRKPGPTKKTTKTTEK